MAQVTVSADDLQHAARQLRQSAEEVRRAATIRERVCELVPLRRHDAVTNALGRFTWQWAIAADTVADGIVSVAKAVDETRTIFTAFDAVLAQWFTPGPPPRPPVGPPGPGFPFPPLGGHP